MIEPDVIGAEKDGDHDEGHLRRYDGVERGGEQGEEGKTEVVDGLAEVISLDERRGTYP